jgi:hypothetical protein
MKLRIELVYSSFEPPTVALKAIEEAGAKFKDRVSIKRVDSWKNQERMEELGFYGLLPISNLLVLVNDSRDHPLAKRISSLAHKGKIDDLIKELEAALDA